MRASVGISDRPLLLLDVDGVLQPVGRSVPPGYERFTDDASNVVLSRTHGLWLTRLATRFDLVWATTWGSNANLAIGRRLGLPDLPHIRLHDLPRTGTRKLATVADYVGDRAVAWIDDELYEDAVAWAADRAVPTLLRRTAPGVGLRKPDVDALEAFAAELRPPASTTTSSPEPRRALLDSDPAYNAGSGTHRRWLMCA